MKLRKIKAVLTAMVFTMTLIFSPVSLAASNTILAQIKIGVQDNTGSDNTGSEGGGQAPNNYPTAFAWLIDQKNSQTTQLTPQVVHKMDISISDNDTLNDIEYVNIVFYHSSIGQPPSSGDGVFSAVYRWTPDAGFTKVESNPTSWTIEPGSQSPDLSAKTGTLTLLFKPGKAARMTDASSWWTYVVKVRDKKGAEYTFVPTLNGGKYAMLWYGEVQVEKDFIDLGSATKNGAGNWVGSADVGVRSISNGLHGLRIARTNEWRNESGFQVVYDGTLAQNNSFRLFAGHPDTPDDTLLPAGKNTPVDIEGFGGIGPTDETGTVSTVKLTAEFRGEVPPGTYQGTLQFTVVKK